MVGSKTVSALMVLKCGILRPYITPNLVTCLYVSIV